MHSITQFSLHYKRFSFLELYGQPPKVLAAGWSVFSESFNLPKVGLTNPNLVRARKSEKLTSGRRPFPFSSPTFVPKPRLFSAPGRNGRCENPKLGNWKRMLNREMIILGQILTKLTLGMLNHDKSFLGTIHICIFSQKKSLITILCLFFV